MTDGSLAFNDTQLQAILATIKALKNEGIHWEQVISIFLSALSGMGVGILLELYKSSRERAKTTRERLEREVKQINTVIVGIGYNIDTLTHGALQNIIPHHQQSHEAYNALQAAGRDAEKIEQVFQSLGKYQALMMTCPELFVIEVDFLEKMSFITEKDPELVKKSGWIISLSRILNNAIRDRNKYVEMARTATTRQGEISGYQLNSILQILVSISNAECTSIFQLFQVLLSTASSLEALNATYGIPGEKLKLTRSEAIKDAISKLEQIANPIIDDMSKSTI
jgi:hypothetical protein